LGKPAKEKGILPKFLVGPLGPKLKVFQLIPPLRLINFNGRFGRVSLQFNSFGFSFKKISPKWVQNSFGFHPLIW